MNNVCRSTNYEQNKVINSIDRGQFNSSVSTTCKSKKELEKLTSLYDLDLFSLNTTLDYNLNPVDYSSNRITSRYFSPHSFKEMKTKLSKDEATSSFSVFHNNVVSLNRNPLKILKLNFDFCMK